MTPPATTQSPAHSDSALTPLDSPSSHAAENTHSDATELVDLPSAPKIDGEAMLEIFVHRSMKSSEAPISDSPYGNGPRLEALGESVLETVYVDLLFNRRPLVNADELKVEMPLQQSIEKWVSAYGWREKVCHTTSVDLSSPEESRIIFTTYVGAVFVGAGYKAVRDWIGLLIDPQAQQPWSQPSRASETEYKRVSSDGMGLVTGLPHSQQYYWPWIPQHHMYGQQQPPRSLLPPPPPPPPPVSAPSPLPIMQTPHWDNDLQLSIYGQRPSLAGAPPPLPTMSSHHWEHGPQPPTYGQRPPLTGAPSPLPAMPGSHWPQAPQPCMYGQQQLPPRPPPPTCATPPPPPPPLPSGTQIPPVRISLGTAFLPLFHQTAQQRRLDVQFPALFTGPPHTGHWTVSCLINGIEKGAGTGSSKQLAKEEAAREAYNAMGWALPRA